MGKGDDTTHPASHRVFLLSPANLAGKRAAGLLAGDPGSDLARRVHSPGGSTLSEVFTFTSSLYFRGKCSYALSFADPPPGLRPAYVITTTRGLLPLDTPVGVDDLRELAAGTVDPSRADYREPLLRSARALVEQAPDCEAVLLGSIATDKYLPLLLEAWGRRLRFPREFVGRGDMSRGGLLLRCVAEKRELEYVAARGSRVRGTRPPRLGHARRPGAE